MNLANHNISSTNQKTSIVNRSNSAGSVKSNVISPANSHAILNTLSQLNNKSSSNNKLDEGTKQPIKLPANSVQKEPSNNQLKPSVQKDQRQQQQPIKMPNSKASTSNGPKKEEETNQLRKPSILTNSSSNIEIKSGNNREDFFLLKN